MNNVDKTHYSVVISKLNMQNFGLLQKCCGAVEVATVSDCHGYATWRFDCWCMSYSH